MMKKLLSIHRIFFPGVLVISTGALLLASLLYVKPLTAAPVPFGDVCIAETNARLAKEQRLFRRSLYGLQKAADEPKGATHYDTEGNAWIKNGTNQWKSQAQGFENTTWSDSQMDSQVEKDPLLPSSVSPFQKGIYETKGVLTSELIPPITQSFRAFQCRTQALCKSVEMSLQATPATAGTPLKVNIPGCIEMTIPTLKSCVIPEGGTDALGVTSAFAYCEPVAEAMLDREEDLLKLSVSYDASYRSLLQFSGNFDDFLQLFQVDLLTPLQQATPLLKQLSRIPCFLSECSE